MIEKDKTYTYKELYRIFARAISIISNDYHTVNYGFVKLLTILFQDEELNKEVNNEMDKDVNKLFEEFIKLIKKEKEN